MDARQLGVLLVSQTEADAVELLAGVQFNAAAIPELVHSQTSAAGTRGCKP